MKERPRIDHWPFPSQHNPLCTDTFHVGYRPPPEPSDREKAHEFVASLYERAFERP